MGLQRTLSVLVALTVLFAPAVTSVAAARAAVPDHQMQMMEAGHCKSMPSSDHGKMDGKSCCISICIGLAVVPSTPAAENVQRPPPPVFSVPTIHRPYLAEIATPPPRHS